MRVAAVILKAALFVAYPFLLYLGVRSGNVRAVGLATALVALFFFVSRRLRSKEAASALVAGPLAIVSLGLASAISEEPRFVLAMPVLANGAMFAQFAGSLASTPIIERFARLVETELSDAQIAYCRVVTRVWCGYFVLNGAIAAFLAITGRTEAWTLHTGLLGYLGMGLLGGTEYIVRKTKFRRFEDHFVDRLLARVLPNRSGS